MTDSRIYSILQYYTSGLTIKEIIDKLLPDVYEYNNISIICHNMVNRDILIKERNQYDIFVYRIKDTRNITIPPPNKDSNIKVITYLDK